MKRYDLLTIRKLLKQFHIPTIETSEDVLKNLTPKRQYLGPGFWLKEIQIRNTTTNE
jgi:hypothetical protein